MNFVTKCLICDSIKLDTYPAITSPFISERIWDSKPIKINLMHCQECDFEFYNLRFNDTEASLLYQGYRDDIYQKQRNKHEAWYTEEINSLLNNNPIGDPLREKHLTRIINDHLDYKKINSVLDFGGDKGQHIPGIFSHAERYVFDISCLNPIPGVKVINDISTANKIKFDFITCSSVLEHVTDPRETLNQIKQFSHRDTVFYFEVPFDSPLLYKKKNFFKDTIKKYLFSHIKVYRVFHFLMNTIGKTTYIFNMHEHINHFSKKSLKHLFETNGFNIEYLENSILDIHWTQGEIISCLLKIK